MPNAPEDGVRSPIKFLPREGDLSREELTKRAEEVRANPSLVLGVPCNYVDIYFKSTCPECGERCTFDEPNTMFESMICATCNHEFPFTVGGFRLQFIM